MKQSAQNKIIFFWRKNNKIAEKKRIFSIWKFSKKFSLFSFEERGRAWETKGQHVCSANASPKAVRNSCGVGFPKWNPQAEFTPGEDKQRVSRHLCRWNSCLSLCLLGKGLNVMSLCPTDAFCVWKKGGFRPLLRCYSSLFLSSIFSISS